MQIEFQHFGKMQNLKNIDFHHSMTKVENGKNKDFGAKKKNIKMRKLTPPLEYDIV